MRRDIQSILCVRASPLLLRQAEMPQTCRNSIPPALKIHLLTEKKTLGLFELGVLKIVVHEKLFG